MCKIMYCDEATMLSSVQTTSCFILVFYICLCVCVRVCVRVCVQVCFAPCFLASFLGISGSLNGLSLEDNIHKLERVSIVQD